MKEYTNEKKDTGQKKIIFQITALNDNNDYNIEVIDQLSGEVLVIATSEKGFVPFGEFVQSINRFYIVYRSGGVVENNVDGGTVIPLYIAKIFCTTNGCEISSHESRYYVPNVIFNKNRVIIISRILDTVVLDGTSILNYKVAIFSLALPDNGEPIQRILSQISKDYIPNIIIAEGIIGIVWNSGYITSDTLNKRTLYPNYVAGVFWMDDGEKIVSRNSIDYLPQICFPFSEIEIVVNTNNLNPIIERFRFDVGGGFLWSEICPIDCSYGNQQSSNQTALQYKFNHSNKTILNVFPNPIKQGDNLSINMIVADIKQELIINLYDLSGRLLVSNAHIPNSSNTVVEIATLNLSAGMYLLIIQLGEDFVRKNILIQPSH